MGLTQITTRLIKNAAVTLAKLGALTTKGDILAHDGTNHVRMPVGANNKFLIADSAQTNGIRYGFILNNKGDLITSTGSADVGLAVGSNDTVLAADSSQSSGLAWKSVGTVVGTTENYKVPAAGFPQTTRGFGTATQVEGVYLGKADSAFTQAKVVFFTTTSAASVTWAEVAIAKGAMPTGITLPTVTTVGFVDISTEATGTAGTFEKTITLSGVAKGDGLWLIFGRNGGSGTLTIGAVAAAATTANAQTDLIRQFCPYFNVRPQSLSSTLAIEGSGAAAAGVVRFT